MGHYRSEMGYEAEDERRAKFEKERKERAIEDLKKRIAEKGIEEVLADIILDPQMTRLGYL